MIFFIPRTEPLQYLNQKVWDYVLSEEVKNFLNNLDHTEYRILRSPHAMYLELHDDNHIIMFKLLFGDYLNTHANQLQ